MYSSLLKRPIFQKVRQAPQLFALLGFATLASVGSGMPAQAVGFLDLNSENWSGASACEFPGVSINCIDDLSTNSATLVGGDESNSGLTYTSSPVPTGYTSVSFIYSFEQLGDQTAFYQVGSVIVPLDDTGGSLNSITISSTLDAGEIFRFGVSNNGTAESGILSISNFNATPVPAPLPLLGGAAAFGWIRRRRSQLKARQLVR